MIAALEHARAFQRPEIGDAFDHADQPLVAARIAADGARIAAVQIAAGRAGMHAVAHFAQGGGQRHQQRILLLQKMQRRAACRTRPQARQTRQELDQPLDLRTGHDG
jgi:hypothetical protein